jgi:hypothetical protein
MPTALYSLIVRVRSETLQNLDRTVPVLALRHEKIDFLIGEAWSPQPSAELCDRSIPNL